MKETRADTARAIGYSLLLHALPLALALLGLLGAGSRVSGSAMSAAIETDLVDPSALSAAMRRAMRPQVQSQQAQTAMPAPPQPPAPIPEDAQAEPQPAEQEHRPLPDVVQENLKQIPDGQAPNSAETSAQADAAANTSLPHGNDSVDADLLERYQAALQDAILRNWTRPGWVPVGQRCKLIINQVPGGEVIEVQVDPSCPYDELARRSVEAAVLKAQPLPYSGFESVFQNVLTLDFEAQGQ